MKSREAAEAVPMRVRAVGRPCRTKHLAWSSLVSAYAAVPLCLVGRNRRESHPRQTRRPSRNTSAFTPGFHEVIPDATDYFRPCSLVLCMDEWARNGVVWPQVDEWPSALCMYFPAALRWTVSRRHPAWSSEQSSQRLCSFECDPRNEAMTCTASRGSSISLRSWSLGFLVWSSWFLGCSFV